MMDYIFRVGWNLEYANVKYMEFYIKSNLSFLAMTSQRLR